MRASWAVLAAAVLWGAAAARAADETTLKNLQAPPPAEVRMLPAGTHAVKFARVVVQLKPEPWALVEVGPHAEGNEVVYPTKRLITWQEGQQEVKASVVSTIFDEEMRAAGGKTTASSESLFSADSDAELLVAVRVNEMSAHICQHCAFFMGSRWQGAVTMSAHWEVYSPIERKVLATIDTHGGFTTPRGGLDGESDRLINEAFRDNVRRLVATDAFRAAIARPDPTGPASQAPTSTPISFAPASLAMPIGQATQAVAVIYSNDGAGSGFLIGREGYLLTNHHVVGGSKFVKVKWSSGSETLGQVVRSDRRRDVALIKVDAQGRSPLAIRSGETHQGEPVFVIGTPLDDSLQNTMTKGIVSANRTMDGLSFIQSDAVINHGNSGGPLLDDKGQVIGIAVIGLLANDAPMGFNFFIPIDEALRALSLTPAAAPAPAPAVHRVANGRPAAKR